MDLSPTYGDDRHDGWVWAANHPKVMEALLVHECCVGVHSSRRRRSRIELDFGRLIGACRIRRFTQRVEIVLDSEWRWICGSHNF